MNKQLQNVHSAPSGESPDSLQPDCSVPAKGFITAPTLEQLRPTPRERYLLEVLWAWQEQSAKSKLNGRMEQGRHRTTH